MTSISSLRASIFALDDEEELFQDLVERTREGKNK